LVCVAAVCADRLALLLALWGAAAVAAPQQRAEPPVLTVRTELVTLSVTVVDRHGALVTGLRPEHFTVYDNGEPQAIQFFTSDDVPATIGLLVDSSGSMRGRREYAAAAVTAFADVRHPLDEFFALHFNEVVWPVTVSLAPAQGLTALYDAIDRGLSDLHLGTKDRKALILVSDGGDNASVRTLDAVLDSARRANVAIYSVTVFDPDNRDARPKVLRALTRETGGRPFTATNIEDMRALIARIVEEVRTGYTIGFTPTHTRGGYRSIRVLADAGNHRELSARTRAGYYAGP
jgi:Ca-activated chloride channel family protein